MHIPQGLGGGSAPHLWNVADAAGAAITLSAPIWWDLISDAGHLVMLAIGVFGGGLRIAILWREWRRGEEKAPPKRG